MLKNKCINSPTKDLSRLHLINTLKERILELKSESDGQKCVIEMYAKKAKNWVINQQELQIQKLNDDNKRLLILIEELKESGNDFRNSVRRVRRSTKNSAIKKNIYNNTFTKEKTIDYESKYFDIVSENDRLRKEIIVLKSRENTTKPPNLKSLPFFTHTISEVESTKSENKELEKCLSSKQKELLELEEKMKELEKKLEDTLNCCEIETQLSCELENVKENQEDQENHEELENQENREKQYSEIDLISLNSFRKNVKWENSFHDENNANKSNILSQEIKKRKMKNPNKNKNMLS